jgi:UPF0271 protein
MMDINCDMGEGVGNDAMLMPYIDSANISCGYHAGDAETIRKTVLMAKEFGVNVGAHPSYPDKKNFGRVEISCTSNEIYDIITEQLMVMERITRACGVMMKHVKPHGALYNVSARDKKIASSIARAVHEFNPSLTLYGLCNSYSIQEAKEIGLDTASEAFADRTYQDDGSLTPRTVDQALITDPNQMLAQVKQIIQQGTVTTLTGAVISMKAQTICIHGDGAHAMQFAHAIRQLWQS